MTPRRRAAVALAGAGVACAAAGGSVPAPLAASLLATLLLHGARFARRGLTLSPAVGSFLWVSLAVTTLLLVPVLAGAALFPRILAIATAGFLVLRSFAPASVYNDFLVVLLSLLLMVGSAAGAEGVGPMALPAAYLVVAAVALPSLASGWRVAGHDPTLRVRSAGASWPWRVARGAIGVFFAILGILLGAMLYLAVPRPVDAERDLGDAGEALQARAARRRGAAGAASAPGSSFDPVMTLGDMGSLQEDPRRVLWALVSKEAKPYEPGQGQETALLLRAQAWDRYDAATATWRATRQAWADVDEDGLLRRGHAPISWQIRLQDAAQPELFVPPLAALLQGVRARLDRHGNLARAGPGREYRVEAFALRGAPQPWAGLLPDRSDAALLRVPSELAGGLDAFLGGARPRGAAEALDLVRRLFRDGGFVYSRSVPLTPPGGDPILSFLERREGHCEYFASATCLLLRRLGLPARCAGGLRLHERIRPGEYVARWRDAHAWVEIAFQDEGFLPVDFTPADDALSAAPPYPEQDAEQALSRAEGDGGDLFPWRDLLRYGRSEQRRLAAWIARLLRAPPAAVAAAAALLGLFLVVRTLRRTRKASPLRVRAPAGGSLRAVAFYARFLRSCAAAGYRRAAHQTPREFLGGLPAPLRADGEGTTRAFEAMRYGAPDPGGYLFTGSRGG
ncbi:MAG: transglutaminase-like domain-containing protein [Planctomycetaceae bacterium]